MEVKKLSITAEELNAMPISSFNSYNREHVNFANNYTGDPTIVMDIECPGGFLLIGYNDSKSNMRISKVFDSNGKYVISFDLKGSQNTNDHAFALEFNDIKIDELYLTDDNEWRHYEYVVDVKNYSNVYNFIDFENIGWLYIYINNIQIRKCNDVGYAFPTDMIVNKQVFQVVNADYAIENGTTYRLDDNATNKPSVYGGIIKTVNTGSWIFQTFHGVTNEVWSRTKDNWRDFVWTAWKELTN